MPDTKAIGVAYRDQAIEGGSITDSSVSATTLAVSGATALNGNATIGDASTDLVGFHGATAVDQYALIPSLTASTTLTQMVVLVNMLIDMVREKGLVANS